MEIFWNAYFIVGFLITFYCISKSDQVKENFLQGRIIITIIICLGFYITWIISAPVGMYLSRKDKKKVKK